MQGIWNGFEHSLSRKNPDVENHTSSIFQIKEGIVGFNALIFLGASTACVHFFLCLNAVCSIKLSILKTNPKPKSEHLSLLFIQNPDYKGTPRDSNSFQGMCKCKW